MVTEFKLKHEQYELIEKLTNISNISYSTNPNPEGFDISLYIELSDETVITVDTYVDCKYNIVDHGIGYYEYGSQKCRDVQMGWECEYMNFSEEFPPNIMPKLNEILEKLDERICEECDLPEPDCDDYDGHYDDY